MSTPKLRNLLLACCIPFHLAPGCERSSSTGDPEVESPDVEAELVEDSAPEVIDSDWVASKLELPPPPKENDWLEEIDKDPIRALKEMDPAALQPRREQAPPPREVGEQSQPQPGLSSIDRYAQTYARTSLDHPDVVFVQLVLYGMDGRSPPTRADVRAWARHFGLSRKRNEVVLIGDDRFISPVSRRLISGFHLIDQQGILRSITSNDPRHDDLYTALLPKLASLVEQGR